MDFTNMSENDLIVYAVRGDYSLRKMRIKDKAEALMQHSWKTTSRNGTLTPIPENSRVIFSPPSPQSA